jgi:short-subunit dehydrogenase
MSNGKARASERRLALVTGVSSGIGMALAERLARDGYDLVVVARRRERLESLAEPLRAERGAGVGVLVADLTDDGDVAVVERRVADEPRLALLVNNAGFPGYGRFTEVEAETLRAVVAIHAMTPMRRTRAALPGMLARRSGAIVNVSSLLSLSGPVPMRMAARATYAGAKSFQLVFTQSLAQELDGTGVRAMVCLPGMVESEFHGITSGDRPPGVPPLMPAEEVATAIVAGLARGEVVCVPGLEDDSVFERLAGLQGAAMAGGNLSGRLASRYR